MPVGGFNTLFSGTPFIRFKFNLQKNLPGIQIFSSAHLKPVEFLIVMIVIHAVAQRVVIKRIVLKKPVGFNLQDAIFFSGGLKDSI
jgi:hypothetical protein